MAVTETDRATPATDSPPARVLAATIRCFGRWGLAKTTLDDIAREAGLSRATVYRFFPGGKDALVRAAVAAELTAFEAGLADRLAGVTGLEDTLVEMVTYSTSALRGHEALQFLLAHEPDQVLPHLAFGSFDQVLAGATAIGDRWLEPFVGAEHAGRIAEWVARLVISYALSPSPWFDLADEVDARRFVRTFLVPGLSGKASDHG